VAGQPSHFISIADHWSAGHVPICKPLFRVPVLFGPRRDLCPCRFQVWAAVSRGQDIKDPEPTLNRRARPGEQRLFTTKHNVGTKAHCVAALEALCQGSYRECVTISRQSEAQLHQEKSPLPPAPPLGSGVTRHQNSQSETTCSSSRTTCNKTSTPLLWDMLGRPYRGNYPNS
jgi:hypothetical protein